MVLFWSKLSERNDKISSFFITANSLHIVFCVTRWIYCFNLAFRFFPKTIHMTSSPTRICRDLIGITTTPLIKLDEHFVINRLDLFSICVFVVELLFASLYIFNHIGAHSWVMSVRVYL